MNLGIIAILMHQFPYQFHGLPVLSTIAFLVDFVLFIVVSVLLLLRFAMFRGQAYDELTDDVGALGLLACWPIAWETLVAFITLTVSEAHWGGHAFTIVAYVMWWIGAVWTIGTLLFVFMTLITRHKTSDRQLPPLLLIPAVGVATVSTIGGLVSSYAAGISARMAVPVIIFAFFTAGIALFMATFLYTLLLHGLLTAGWPAPEQSPLMFILVGPMGQTASAFQLLGSAASTYGRFAGYHKGTFLTLTAASPLDTACVLFGLLLSGMGTIWLILAFCVMFYRAYRRELTWNPAWNSIIFPTGTLTTSMLMFSIEMDSPFFRVITGILLVFLIIMFFVNLAFTAWEIFRGRLLIVREDRRVIAQLDGHQKER